MSTSGAPRGLAAAPVSAEGLLSAILETSDDAIVTHDASGRITSWSRSAERIFGYGADDIVGRPCLELFAVHLRDDVEAVLLNGDGVSHHETEILRRDGMPVLITLSVCPVHDDGGRPVASLLIARDITEQRLAQASLAEIEARVRESEALANVGSWLWDLRSGVVQWSDEFYRVHGVDPLDFGGTLDAHLRTVHADDLERVRVGVAASVESARAFDLAYRIVRPDGDVRMLHVRAQPIVGSDGSVVGLRGIGQDITDRR